MKIIFKNQDNSIGIITPSDEALSFATIEQIAEKDVPAPYKYPSKWGVDNDGEDIVLEYQIYSTPYLIVEDSVIPENRTFRSAWEVDEAMGKPDGFGGESSEFDDDLLKAYHGELNDSNK